MPANAARIIMLSLLAAWSLPSIADPPWHAPAHGWRRHHERDHRRDRDERGDRDERRERGDEDDGHYYVGDTGEHWERDYGILSGRCNRKAVATAVGGVVGAVIGSRVSAPQNRTVATIIGAAAGALLGRKIGHALDKADRGCFGHALELGRPGRRVVWTDDSTGVRYVMVPGANRERNGLPCRNFTLSMIVGGKRSTRVGIACRSEPGLWKVL